MWNGFHKLVTWSTFMTIITYMFVGIGNATPGISEILKPNFETLWIGTLAGLIPGVIIIGIVTLIGQRLMGLPLEYNWARAFMIASCTALVAIWSMIAADEWLLSWNIPPHMNINFYAASLFAGGVLAWMIMIGIIQAMYETMATLASGIAYLIAKRLPKRKNEILQWEIPKQ